MKRFFGICVALGVLAIAAQAQAVLISGDVAVIGFIDNGSPDSFAFVNLATIDPGQDIYFTDNGWTGTQFRSGSPTDGDGNENLIKFTAINSIAAGTIISSVSTSANYLWTKTGAVPGGTSGAFADLSLSQTGEQIYAFLGAASLPLQNPTTHLFVLDDTNGFENATDSAQGNVTPGLTAGSTALTFNFASANSIAFNTNTLASGTKQDWLNAMSNSANWTTATGAGGSLPSGSISVVPEPSSLMLGALAVLGVGVIYRRNRNVAA